MDTITPWNEFRTRGQIIAVATATVLAVLPGLLVVVATRFAPATCGRYRGGQGGCAVRIGQASLPVRTRLKIRFNRCDRSSVLRE